MTSARIEEALLSVSDRCDVACRFCFRADKGGAVLTRQKLARILSRLREFGLRSVCFTGGEPSDHPDFVEFCRIALQFGMHPSVVTAARSKSQVDRLRAAAKFLIHVTVSADSASVCRKFESPRTIAGAGGVLARLDGPSKSLHVVIEDVEPADAAAIGVAIADGDAALELSPRMPATPTRASTQHADTLARFRHDLEYLQTQFALSLDLAAILTELPRSHCAKRRLYVSAAGQLRFCPYHKAGQADVDTDRAELNLRLSQLSQQDIPQSSLCWLVCRKS